MKLTEVGPLRHPKPITPSDLHLVLEKEQEAMVCIEENSFVVPATMLMLGLLSGEPVDSGALSPPPADSLRGIDSLLYINPQ